MFVLFTVAALCWAFLVAILTAFDPRALAAHWFTVLWVSALLVGLPFAWRWLRAYKATASVAARVDAAEGKLWTVVLLHLEGAKSAILMAVASAFATGKDWVDSLAHTLFGLAPSDLDPFKDATLLHTFFTDAVVLKAIAGISFLAALLSIKGKLTAAKITPAATTPAS